METKIPAESIVPDEAENQSFLGFKLEALIHLEKSVAFQQLRKRSMDCGRDDSVGMRSASRSHLGPVFRLRLFGI
jgi:hypothetical protein